MRKGDWVFFYHSGNEKSAVGIAKVDKPAYRDPTAEEGDWSAVDLVPVKPLAIPVTLGQLKNDPVLKELQIVRNSRLSVTAVTDAQFERILKLARSTA